MNKFFHWTAPLTRKGYVNILKGPGRFCPCGLFFTPLIPKKYFTTITLPNNNSNSNTILTIV